MKPEPDEAPKKEEVTRCDLECCPRCGSRIDDLIWGQTNCPNCGLHFECC